MADDSHKILSVLEGSLTLISVKWRKGGHAGFKKKKKKRRYKGAKCRKWLYHLNLASSPWRGCSLAVPPWCTRSHVSNAGLWVVFDPLDRAWGVALKAQGRQRFAQTACRRQGKCIEGLKVWQIWFYIMYGQLFSMYKIAIFRDALDSWFYLFIYLFLGTDNLCFVCLKVHSYGNHSQNSHGAWQSLDFILLNIFLGHPK